MTEYKQMPMGPTPIQYMGTTETAAQMLTRLGDDASKWANEFRSTAIRLGYSDMDEGWLIGWFANAIEHSFDIRRWRAEKQSSTATQTAEQQPDVTRLVEALKEIATWPDGGSTYGQEKIKAFANATLEAHRKGVKT